MTRKSGSRQKTEKRQAHSRSVWADCAFFRRLPARDKAPVRHMDALLALVADDAELENLGAARRM